jgi:hypothetical protein
VSILPFLTSISSRAGLGEILVRVVHHSKLANSESPGTTTATPHFELSISVSLNIAALVATGLIIALSAR